MRVTHIITRLVVGGAQENTVATVLGLRAKPGVQVELLSGPTTGPEGSMESSFAECPQLLAIVPSLVRPIRPWKDLLALAQLTRLLRSRRPGIVHTHSGKAGFLGRLAARRARVPVIVHHIHGPSFGPFQGAFANALFLGAERYAAKVTDHFICSAQAMARIYQAAGIGRPEMYTRIFSGFEVEPFLKATNDLDLRSRLGLPADAFVIGTIARLAPLKGHVDLLAAFRNLLPRHPEARLLLVGDGCLRHRLETMAQSSELKGKVIFTGLIQPAEVPRYIGIMDCLAHLSSREALSRALPQALAARKPVVTYDFDGADEICMEGETGFLVRTGDVSAVANRLLQLANEPALREAFGSRGQDFVRDRFRLDHLIDEVFELYQKLTRPRPNPDPV